jgi:hypothetical protein
MAHYHNFTTVVYCTAQWAARVSEADIHKQLDFFQQYVGVDKVYLETFRGEQVSAAQLDLCKKVFAERGVTVAGGITTITPDLSADDAKRQRLFNTFCYSNEPMREHLRKVVEYTAAHFDEFIIDDFFFSQCTCADCQKEKGERSWEAFKRDKMREVSENLVIKPARAVNPAIRITIKFPNWKESYQETGYNPSVQKDMFDAIYTGTETRHPVQTDQHLPRYLSYSLMRYLEHVAPGRNGGGWFDPYECYAIDTYLEQGYLTAFAKPRELMLFCWPSLYNNRVVTPLGFRLREIDGILTALGNPQGLPVYLPHDAQGEDHLEDFLGMVGIPFEPTPDFPVYPSATSVFVTAMALHDTGIVATIKTFLNKGGTVLVSSGFMRGALERYPAITELTSIRYRGRVVDADEFHISKPDDSRMFYRTTHAPIRFPLLEHRNNASWSLMNAGHGDQHSGILLRDTFGQGQLITLAVPDLYSDIKRLPREALTRIRREFLSGRVYLDAPPQVSLFTYDNDTFGVYPYTADGCAPDWIALHVMGAAQSLTPLGSAMPVAVQPAYRTETETVFEVRIEPGAFMFYKIA